MGDLKSLRMKLEIHDCKTRIEQVQIRVRHWREIGTGGFSDALDGHANILGPKEVACESMAALMP